MATESSAAALSDSLIEERREFVVSLTGDGAPSLKSCHFLKPLVASIDEQLPSLPLSSKPTVELQSLPLKIEFKGRQCPPLNWKRWVHSLHPKHHRTWEKAGIEEAIIGSTYHVIRQNELVLEVADRWCSKTNTFIFPWGEATITLEDMLVLGGFPVLGDSVLSDIEDDDMLRMRDDLIESWRDIKKINGTKFCSHYVWMELFMGRGNELEHVAFLVLWLSRSVFPKPYIQKDLFHIAIRLSLGYQVALAPAVLANIYRDLSLLKQHIVLKLGDDDVNVMPLILWAPFQLVQVWVWERFPILRPQPNLIKPGNPRVARWHKLRKLKIHDVRLAIDSARECFQWRPYATALSNWSPPMFYRDAGEQALVSYCMDEILKSFARCIRVSELVGLDCIEEYLPHRVAMQFGFDQDIPGCVPGTRNFPKVAWSNYSRPVRDGELYIPSRFSKSDVTVRYLDWWKGSMLNMKDKMKFLVVKKRRTRRSFRTGLNLKKEAWNIVKESKLAPLKVSIAKHDNVGDGLVSNEKVSTGTEFQISSTIKSASSGLVRDGISRDKSPSKILQRGESESVVRHADWRKPKMPISNAMNKDNGNSGKEILGGDKFSIVLKSGGKNNSVNSGIESGHISASGVQTHSSLTTKNGVDIEKASVMKPTEKKMQQETARGNAENTMEDGNVSKDQSLVCETEHASENEGKSCSDLTVDVCGLELEAKIVKLERIVAALKAVSPQIWGKSN